MKNKKGQLEQLGGLAVGLVMITILLTVTFLILSQGRDQSLDITDTTTSINQTFAVTGNVSFLLNGGCNSERDAVVTEVYNDTGSAGATGDFGYVLLDPANYTVKGIMLNISDGSLGGATELSATLNVSYSCLQASYAYNATSELTNATQDIPGWMSLIVVTVIGGILLGLVLVLRGRRQ